MSDKDNTPPGSLWQPVSSGKVTDVAPETITSTSTTIASSPSTVKPSAASTASGSGAPPRDTPPQRSSNALPPPPPPPPPRRGGILGSLITVFAAVLVVLVAAYVTAPKWLPTLMTRAGIANAPPSAPAVGMSDADKQKLDAQLADINARLTALKKAATEPTATDPALVDQIKKLQGQIQQLAKEQSGLNDRIGQLGAPQASDAGKPDPALNARLDALQKQVDAGAAVDNANKDLRGDIEALTTELGKATDRNAKLEQRLAELEKSVASRMNVDQRSIDAARASAITALAARLHSNIDAGRGFASDLASLKPLIGGDTDLAALFATLDPLSSGTDGIAALRQSFPEVARATVSAGNGDTADNWWDKAVARLSSVVSVRRVGNNVTGDTVEAHVARAEAALNLGKLDVAVGELKPLTGNAAKAVAPWLAKAERQLAASTAADKVQALAAQRLAQIEQAR